MAMVTAPPIINNNNNPTSSSTHQNVYLFDWWLFKTQIDVNGKRLAISGFKYRGSKDPQGFSSAPIVEKYDSGTLQTADGVVVHIEGTINKIRCLNNGISSEVCNHFRFGFPYDWDDLRYHCGEDSMSTSTSHLSNDWDNKKEGGTNANLLRKKFKDASKDTVLQAAAECLGQFDVELQKTEDALAKNSVGRAEVVSSTSRGRTDGIKSLGPLEARRSSRLRNTKKRTDDGQNIKTNKSTLVSLESDLVTENEIHCESGVEDVRGSPFTRPHEKSNTLDDVNLTGMKTSPNDGPKISEINAFCDSDSTRADAFGHDIDSDNPSVAMQVAAECLGQFDVELQKTEDALDKNSVGRAEVVSSTSHGRMDGTKKSLGPNEARRSSRLRNTKKRTDGGQNIKTNKSTLVSLESDLVTEDEIHCESGVEDVRGCPFTRPHEKSNSLDDVNLTGMKGKPILTSPNDDPKISKVNAVCDSDSTRADAFGHDIDSDNPSVALQAAAECLGQFDVELQKTEDALDKNSVGKAEVVSSTSHGRMDGTKKSLGPLEARRSSRLRNTKKRTDGGQNLKTNKSTLVSLESDLFTEDEIHCESGVEDVRGSPFSRPHERSNSLDDVNLTGMKGKPILTSPNDGPKISEINAVCDSDSTRADAFGHDIDSDSPSVALQATAECLGQFDVELQKTEDALDKNCVGRAEVGSSTSHGRMDGTKKSLGPNEARRSSRLRNTKKRTDGGQNIKTNKSTLVSLKSDLVTEDEIHCESGVEDVRGSPFTRPHEKSNSLDDVNLTGMKRKPTLTSPNDDPKISEINAFCDNDSTRADAFGHGIDSDNPSAVNMAALAETPNGVGGTEDFSSTSCGKIDGNTQSISLFEARRSSRLMNMKKGTDNRCKARKNEGIHMSLGMHCESGEKDVGGSLFNGPHEKTNCLDDVNLTEGKTSLRNDGSKISEKHPNCCGDATQGDALGCDINSVNPPEINMAALVETPDRYLKCLSRKDLVENSGGEYLSRCFSKKVTPCSKRDSKKKYTFEARATNRMKVVEKGINNETCKSHKTLANVKNDMTMSAGKMDTGDNKLGTSRRKTKRRLDYITEVSTPPISRSKKKKLSLLSPEESSCKKSGSGRLIVPSLDYWRNQQVFYDLNGGVAGVLNGLPLTESCTGNFSESSRKLKKFL